MVSGTTDLRRRRWSAIAGVVVALVCVWFVGQRLADDWAEARDALSSASFGWLVLAVVLAVAGMVTVALGWRAVLAALGHERPTGPVVAWYFNGEIGKYVPGGLWAVVGRGELARRGNVPAGAAYASVALSLGFWYLAAAGFAAALVPAALLLVPVALVCLHPAVSGRVGRLVGVAPLPFGVAIRLALRYVPAWVCIGGATWCVARALDPHASLATVVPATAASWLAGFLFLPAPGGVGVREAVFVALVGNLAPATAVLARVVFISVDAVGAVVGSRFRRCGSSS